MPSWAFFLKKNYSANFKQRLLKKRAASVYYRGLVTPATLLAEQ